MDVFQRFLDLRGRFMYVSEGTLNILANKVRKEYMHEYRQELRETNNLAKKDQITKKIAALKAMKFSSGWAAKFKTRYSIRKRQITTRISKPWNYYKDRIPAWFEIFDNLLEDNKITTVVNFDELSVFLNLVQIQL